MKNPTWKRLGLGLVQQFIALAVMIIVAWILFNSYLSVETMNGQKTYYLQPLSSKAIFEDSDVFGDIFQTAVSDITRLVVIKGQIETDGKFDNRKHIDVTKFAERKGSGNGCNITAVYELDDLIKWGKYGIEYNNRAMSMSEFVNYFGNVMLPENFVLDENHKLNFVGFQKVDQKDEYQAVKIEEVPQEYREIYEEMLLCSQKQLEDLVFSYIIARAPEEITVSREDDGTYTVYIRMLNNRYEPVLKPMPLFEYADNWVDYLKLQQNVVEAITSLTENYLQYQNCNDLYETDKSNIKYVVRMMTTEGLRTYTNLPEVAQFTDSNLTDFFSEYRRYMIYYPDSLEFMGNTGMSEEDIYTYMNEYEYAYPETTHIWIGVDTAYPIAGDAFYTAYHIYQRIVPYVSLIMGILSLLALAWIGIGIYLTLTAGNSYNNQGERIHYINGFDRIWTEVIAVLCGSVIMIGIYGYKQLLIIADQIYVSHMQALAMDTDLIQQYAYFGLYGFGASLAFNLLWYSFIRRLKAGNFWKDSFVNWLISGAKKQFLLIINHKNAVVSTLLPYCMFMLANVLSAYAFVSLTNRRSIQIVIMACIIIFDGFIGLYLFRHNAEQNDIVDGINKIREGEVDYKLDVSNLHGSNREVADAVNNIGEGIRNAVKTSVKDEQMKTNLITNVSHDIKTPLTSIISYIDLLKRLRIEEEPAKGYIEVLDGKAQRLKQLTDDLVEVSKISSGNIILNMERLNPAELLQQAIGEFSDRLEESELSLVFDSQGFSTAIYADSRRMWRVVENLFNNICKYALKGTRVYVELSASERNVYIAIKNISKGRMNVQAEELTERFIRGDSSRTTEGSGLGLSIAKSLVQAQGGCFEITLDGDLFKVVLTFPKYEEPNGDENGHKADTVKADKSNM